MIRSASAFPAAAFALAATLSPLTLSAQPPGALPGAPPVQDVTPLSLLVPENPPPSAAAPTAVLPAASSTLAAPEDAAPAMRTPPIELTPRLIPNQIPQIAEPSLPPLPSPSVRDATDSPLLTEPRFDAFFIDTFASEVATYLSRKVPGLNIMLPMNADSIRIPTMQLKNVNLREFMAALTAASTADLANGNPGYSLSPVPGAPSILIFQQLQPALNGGGGGMSATPYPTATVVPAPGMGGGQHGGASSQNLNRNLNQNLNQGLNRNLNRSLNQTPPPPPGRSHTSFFDLSPILQSKELKVDDITTAIRTAWSSVEGGKIPPEGALKFHQETQLLIVTGTEEYMESAVAIVNLLQNRPKPSLDDREQEMVALRRQIQAIEEERRVEQMKAHEIRTTLQDQIMKLEREAAKAGVAAGTAQPAPEGETPNRR